MGASWRGKIKVALIFYVQSNWLVFRLNWALNEDRQDLSLDREAARKGPPLVVHAAFVMQHYIYICIIAFTRAFVMHRLLFTFIAH